MQDLLSNLGQDHMGWSPAFTDYKQLLEQLKSEDEMSVYQAVLNLQQSLSVAQENTLQNFTLDQYIPALIDILKRPPLSDLSNEVNSKYQILHIIVMVIQCLTNLMDIFPSICNTIINHGGVKCLNELFERNMGFIDLNEACIKAFEKISYENPYAILTSGAMSLCLNMMDFFEMNTQKKIIQLVANVSRHSASEQDFDNFIMPIMPVLNMLLTGQNEPGSQPRTEALSHIILRICESFQRFYNHITQFDKVCLLYQKLAETGIFENVQQGLQIYSVLDQKQIGEKSKEQQTKSLSSITVQNYLKTLTYCCRFSGYINKQLVDQNIFQILNGLLPGQEDQKKTGVSSEQFPFTLEVIQLLDALLPERENQIKQNEQEKMNVSVEKEKRENFMKVDQGKIVFLAEKILPKIFFVYDHNIALNIRLKTLQIIDKMITLFNEELLNNFIEPYSFAKFIYANISQNNPNSILICLQMIQRLLISNSKTYTLPLIREGVVEHIKKLSVKENLEENIQPKSEEESLKIAQLEEEANLMQAKAMLLGQQPADESQRAHFEQVLQKYIEQSKLTKQQLQQKVQKGSGENNAKILELAQLLGKEYFENETFMAKINSYCQEEFQLFDDLKLLTQSLLEESQKLNFDYDLNKSLMKKLQTYLTSNRNVMLYEFKETGLLEALTIYLTCAPNQARAIIEQRKAQKKGEELKRSEEMQISTISKEGKKVSKKEGRCFIQRLKMFTHCILNESNGKRGINEVVQLCHDILSQSENIIFEGQMGNESQPHVGGPFGFQADINQSVNALKQLTRRVRVNLIYDKDKKHLKSLQEQQQPELILENPSQETLSQNLQPQFEPKAKSHNPAFAQIGALPDLSLNKQSKVYMKRNLLYSELKQVLIAVEQCASLYLLEDFLRNKIKSMDDVKSLKTPQSFLDQFQKHAKQENAFNIPPKKKIAAEIMDKAMMKMRSIFENPPGQKLKEENDEFANQMAEEIASIKDLNEEEQITIIYQLEQQSMQMMDDFYAQEDQALDEMRENESFDGRLMSQGNEEEMVEAEQKIYEFQRMIEKMKTLLKEKQKEKAKEKVKENKKEEEKKEEPSQSQSESQTIELKKEDEKKEGIDDNKDQEMEDQSEEIQPKEEENQVKDVEMTDEEEEQRKFIEQQQKLLQKQLNKPQEIDLKQENQSQDPVTLMNEDLEELIKANGEDIEFEFYCSTGLQVSPTLTLFEIQKQLASNLPNLSKQPQKMSSYLHYGSDTLTIYFTITDKREEIPMHKKDSIDLLSARRERTKSEAVDDISTSSINSIVQQIIEKEFNVFSKDLQERLKSKNFKNETQLEQSLKLLKVIYYICKNIQLFTNQGQQFLINTQVNEEEIKEQGFTDMDLLQNLSSIHPKLFHHHKLDSFILKNIQDPFTLMGGAISDALQQIFRNCPFLFPFHTRELFFKLISFIGSIDMNRSIYFLRQFIKARGGRLGGEDKSGIKFIKQKVSVERNKILESAIALTKKMNKRAFIEFEFKDEIGTGLGPTLEFYALLADELKVKKSDLWRSLKDNTLFPSPLQIQKINNEELQKIYEIHRVMGIMVAKSIIDDRLIDLPISSVWWDILLGKKMNIFDLDRINSDVYKVVADLQLLANKKRDIDKKMNLDDDSKLRQIHSLKTNVHFIKFNEHLQSGFHVEDLSLYFVLPGYENIELKPEGKETQVTIHNLQDYIDLLLNFTFHETIKLQTSAFKKGFNSIFPIDCLKPFSTSQELEDMICGTQTNEDEWKNPQRLMENIIPDHGYHQKSFEYQNFIRFVTELEQQERRKFLKFVTGSPRLPNGGFSALEPKLTLVLRKEADPLKNPDHTLPSVMTCQNYLKMPRYSSYEILKKQFETAYNEGSNNFTLS